MTQPCGAIILAAGQSRRMGSNKLLLPFRGKAMIAHVADAVAAANLPAIVVLGHAEQDVRAALAEREVSFVFAEAHEQGMGHSIAAGVLAVPASWQAAIICLADMPLISPILLRQMAQKAAPSAIVVPTFAGKRGNPVLWGRDYFGALTGLTGDVGARMLFKKVNIPPTSIAWHDDTIMRDFDTESDL